MSDCNVIEPDETNICEQLTAQGSQLPASELDKNYNETSVKVQTRVTNKNTLEDNVSGTKDLSSKHLKAKQTTSQQDSNFESNENEFYGICNNTERRSLQFPDFEMCTTDNLVFHEVEEMLHGNVQGAMNFENMVGNSARDGFGEINKVAQHVRSNLLPHYWEQSLQVSRENKGEPQHNVQLSDGFRSDIVHSTVDHNETSFDGASNHNYKDDETRGLNITGNDRSVGYMELIPPDATRSYGATKLDKSTEKYIMGNNEVAYCNFKSPDTYDGTSDLQDYLVYFDILADYNKWSLQQKAYELATSLKGKALAVLTDMTPENRICYDHIISELNSRFQPSGLEYLYKLKWRNMTRKHRQSLAELAQHIKRVTKLAFPNFPAQCIEELSIDCFIQSLDNSELKWEIVRHKPTLLEECVRSGLEFESFQFSINSVKYINDNTLPISELNGESGLGTLTRQYNRITAKDIICKFCNQQGHKKICHAFITFKEKSKRTQ